MNFISNAQLEKVLETKGATIVTIEAEVVPAMRKTANPFFGRVTKVSRVNGMIGWNYENSVNNQRKREGDDTEFEAHPRKWGERVAGTPFVVHKGNTYLEIKVERVLGTVYLLDDRPVTTEQMESIRKFLPKTREPSRQGVAKTVILRDYNLDNIRAVRKAGQDYRTVTTYNPAEIAISA